ncbi:RNA-directed DNA polymerase, eukaryota, partial [Tanacetum coccineum]
MESHHEEDGWKVVSNRKRRDHRNTTISFFFTNIPSRWNETALWKTFTKYGRISDVYIAKKKTVMGQDFGFTRFTNICNLKSFETLLNTITIGFHRLKGLPPQAWHEVAFTRIARFWGDVIYPEKCLKSNNNLVSGKVCIRTKHMELIHHNMPVIIDDIHTCVRIREIMGECDDVFTDENIEDSDSEDDYNSSPNINTENEAQDEDDGDFFDDESDCNLFSGDEDDVIGSSERGRTATKVVAEEENAIRKSNEKTTKKKIKEAKREARKKLAKKKQLERDTEENVSDNEEYDYQSDDVDNKEKTDEEAAKRKAELLAELQAIETRLEKKAKDEAQNEDNDVNVNENADEADNEEDENNEEDDEKNEDDDDDNQEDAENEEDAENAEDADNNEEDDDDNEEDDNEENVDQVFHKIKTLPFLNAATRSNKIEDEKVLEKQHQKKRKMETSESEEPEKKKSKRQKSICKGKMKKYGSKKNPINKESPKRFTRGDAKRQAEFENVNPQNEAEDDEEVKSISSDDEEEQDGINVYKGLDVYVPPINDKEPETKE